MYQVEILNEVEKRKTLMIPANGAMVNEDQSPQLDGNGNAVLNETEGFVEATVDKLASEILEEENFLISEKEEEVQAQVDAYVAAIANQLANGGPGPVAKFDIMAIVNENDGNFEVVFKED